MRHGDPRDDLRRTGKTRGASANNHRAAVSVSCCAPAHSCLARPEHAAQGRERCGEKRGGEVGGAVKSGGALEKHLAMRLHTLALLPRGSVLDADPAPRSRQARAIARRQGLAWHKQTTVLSYLPSRVAMNSSPGDVIAIAARARALVRQPCSAVVQQRCSPAHPRRRCSLIRVAQAAPLSRAISSAAPSTQHTCASLTRTGQRRVPQHGSCGSHRRERSSKSDAPQRTALTTHSSRRTCPVSFRFTVLAF